MQTPGYTAPTARDRLVYVKYKLRWKVFPQCMEQLCVASADQIHFLMPPTPNHNFRASIGEKTKVQGAHNCGKATLSRFHTITTWSPTSRFNPIPLAQYGPFSLLSTIVIII
jgi:hypothetical protein